jgi:hypothetical protein
MAAVSCRKPANEVYYFLTHKSANLCDSYKEMCNTFDADFFISWVSLPLIKTLKHVTRLICIPFILLLLLLLFTAIGFSPGGSSPYTSTHNTNGHIHKNNNTKQTIHNYKTKYIQ